MPTRKTTRRTAQRIRAREKRREKAHETREANHLEVLKILETYREHFAAMSAPPANAPAPKAQPATPEPARPPARPKVALSRRPLAPQVRHPGR